MRKKDDSPPPPEIDAALLAGLASRTGELANLAQDLIETVRLNRFTKALVALVMLVLVVGTAASIWNTTTTKHQTEVIRDCTDPDGTCYKEARKSARDNVKLINDTIVAAVACSKNPTNQTEDDIRSCVIAALSKD